MGVKPTILVSTYPNDVMEALQNDRELSKVVQKALKTAYPGNFTPSHIAKMAKVYDQRLFHYEVVNVIRAFYGLGRNTQIVFNKEVNESDIFNKNQIA